MTHITIEKEKLKLLVEALSLYETRTDGLVNKALAAGKEALAKPEQELDYKAIGQQAYESGYSTGYMDCAVKMKAQPKQKPVAWMDEDGDVLSASVVSGKGLRNIPLYTTPPQRKPLTWEEIRKVVRDANHIAWSKFGRMAKDEEITRATEAAHGIKE